MKMRSAARLIAALCAIIIVLGGVAAYALSAHESRHGAPRATLEQEVKITNDGAILALVALRFDQADELGMTPSEEQQSQEHARKATESLIQICRAQPMLAINDGKAKTIKEYLEDEVKSLRTGPEVLAESREELELALEQHCG